jgi:sarcosine oxidase/L-pipecolate oxidase
MDITFTTPQGISADHMDAGEGMSILKDGTIKFNCDMCFTNYVNNPITGEKMSMAPEVSAYNTWTGPDFVPE